MSRGKADEILRKRRTGKVRRRRRLRTTPEMGAGLTEALAKSGFSTACYRV
jgi:hypothetical protein